MKILSFIIVNYNGMDFLNGLLESLEELNTGYGEKSAVNYKKSYDSVWEAIFFDNGSTDGSLEFLREKCLMNTNLRLIESKTNTGFCFASNEAARQAESEYLVFLNPDTVIKTKNPDILLSFVKEKADSGDRMGALGVKTLNIDGTLQFSCRTFPTIARQFYESFFLAKLFRKSRIFGSYFMTWWDHRESREVDWVSGSFLLIKKELFFSMNGFDEDYFMYSEDTDLCKRLKKKGYKNYYFPDFEIIHLDSAIALRDFANREKGIWKSRKLYFEKNHSGKHALVISFLCFCGNLKRAFLFLLLYLFTFKRKNIIRSCNYFKAIKSYLSGS
jgi:GT2 family glycosyltransferase